MVHTHDVYLLVDLVPKHAEFKPLELHHKHSWRLVDGHALGSSYFLLLLGADVFVCAIQVLTTGKSLQCLQQRAGFVDLKTQV